MIVSTAWAQAAGGASGGGGDLLGAFLPLILIFAVFYFLLIRPQQKRQKEHQAKLKSIRRGDRIVTGGGIIGTVTKVEGESELQVEIAEGVRVKVVTGTVVDVLNKIEPAADKKEAAPANDASEKKSGLGKFLGGKSKKD